MIPTNDLLDILEDLGEVLLALVVVLLHGVGSRLP
jgi:hypothetical protein